MKHSRIGYISTAILASAVLVAAFCCMRHNHIPASGEVEAPDSTDTVIVNVPVHLNESITNETFAPDSLIDRKVLAYMRRWELKGAQLAITKHGQLKYARGYGKADEGVEMTPGHIMRVASVSKLITATAIMKLQEEGLLNLQDTVFGPKGLLNEKIYNDCIGKKEDFKTITVEHLLRHQAGFRRDPLFGIQDLMRETFSDEPLTHDQTLKLGLFGKLRFQPGTWKRYSNMGYFLLCDIIEKVSDTPYEEYVRTHVLEPAGCFDMHIGGNFYEDKRPNETRYYVQEGPGKYIPDYRDTTLMTERCYGGNDLKILGGAGGWIASAVEIAQLVACIDGDPAVEDIISRESFFEMISFVEERYSLGWNSTDPNKGWQRSGTLSGTSSLIYHFPDGECWVLLMNSGTAKGPRQADLTEALFRDCRDNL